MKNRNLYFKFMRVYYPICRWIGHHILHLDNRKHFKVGDVVYTWDDELNCVDKGIIEYLEDYVDELHLSVV